MKILLKPSQPGFPQSGFSTVELLIIAVIVFILGALISVQYTGVRARDRDSERKNDIKALQEKAAAYFAVSGKYPLNLAEIKDLPQADCQAPRNHGTCIHPDYAYKAFKKGTLPAINTASDCDNKTTATACSSYLIYTNSMETVHNPYQVTN